MAVASVGYSPLRLKTRQDASFFPAQDAVSPLHSPIFKGPSKRANLIVRSRADAPHLKKAALAIEQAAWSNLGYLSYTRSHYEYYAELLDAYPEFQLCLVDEETDYPVAVASSVPFVCSGPDDLPPEGWDWVVETAARNKAMKPNMLGGLAVSVPAVHRSKGYARVLIRSLLQLAESQRIGWGRGARAPISKGHASLGPDRRLHGVDRRQRATL